MAPDPREGAPWRGALALGVGQSRSKVTCRTHPHFSLLRLSELLAGLPLEKPAEAECREGGGRGGLKGTLRPTRPGRSLGNN